MQQTLAFAPTEDDLDEVYFDSPVIALIAPAATGGNTDEAEPGEAGPTAAPAGRA